MFKQKGESEGRIDFSANGAKNDINLTSESQSRVFVSGSISGLQNIPFDSHIV